VPQNKSNKTQFLPEHKVSLAHWRDELLKLGKTYSHKDNDKKRIIINMLDKYLDDVIIYNKSLKKS
jgi:hypothetical protein